MTAVCRLAASRFAVKPSPGFAQNRGLTARQQLGGHQSRTSNQPTASRGLSSNQCSKRHRCSSPKRQRAPVLCWERTRLLFSRHRPAAASPEPNSIPIPATPQDRPLPAQVPIRAGAARNRAHPMATRRPSQPSPPSYPRSIPIRPSPPTYPLQPDLSFPFPMPTPHSAPAPEPASRAELRSRPHKPMPVPAKANTHRLPAFRSRFFLRFRFFAVTRPRQMQVRFVDGVRQRNREGDRQRWSNRQILNCSLDSTSMRPSRSCPSAACRWFCQ